jgi:hypothetical protein
MDKLGALMAAQGKTSQPQQPKAQVANTQPSETKRVSNRSITCSQDLRDRLRIMAATKGVPMQALLEEWMTEKLEAAGF